MGFFTLSVKGALKRVQKETRDEYKKTRSLYNYVRNVDANAIESEKEQTKKALEIIGKEILDEEDKIKAAGREIFAFKDILPVPDDGTARTQERYASQLRGVIIDTFDKKRAIITEFENVLDDKKISPDTKKSVMQASLKNLLQISDEFFTVISLLQKIRRFSSFKEFMDHAVGPLKRNLMKIEKEEQDV
ncbi:hypothetical protein GOV10_02240, partial [Candidatus Woesearchaeota archaeon]|nr:hypothetical protein [Candidatus Woesearchaeota archaeon]